VSFISLKKVLPAVLACADPDGFDCLAMVKPQFEVGRERVGKGVVHDPELRREAVDGVAEAVRAQGYEIAGEAESALPGPKGNIETFLWIR
jgi:23S rRNA (cytidine1920-2'-O)/16S rRNA (cytidine1409-2'-O)-methyltransferase